MDLVSATIHGALVSFAYRRGFPGFSYRSCIGDDSPPFVIGVASATIEQFCQSRSIGDESPIPLIALVSASIHRFLSWFLDWG
jgi:hypothetical protein